MAEIDVGVEKLKVLVDDKVFSKKLKALKTAEEVQSLLQENGVNFDTDVVKTMWSLVNLRKEGKIDDEDLDALDKGELTESMMEAVNGGVLPEESFSDLQSNHSMLQENHAPLQPLQPSNAELQSRLNTMKHNTAIKGYTSLVTSIGSGVSALIKLFLRDN